MSALAVGLTGPHAVGPHAVGRAALALLLGFGLLLACNAPLEPETDSPCSAIVLAPDGNVVQIPARCSEVPPADAAPSQG